MRILHVYDSLTPHGGGSQKVALLWVKNLLAKGYTVKLYCNSKDSVQNIDDKALIIDGGFSMGFIYPGLSLPLIFGSSQKSLVTDFKPDIIHFHEPSLLGVQIQRWAQKNSIPTVMSYHTNYQNAAITEFPLSLFWNTKFGIGNRVVNALQSSLLRNADLITVPSLFYKEKLQNVFNKKISLLPYPIKKTFFVRSFSNAPSKEKKLITISRLSGEKKIDRVIRIMPYLDKNYTLTIVGDGVERKFLENLIQKLDLTKRVFMKGWIPSDRLPSVLQQHTLFISLSENETFGLTYMESLLQGLPCVVKDYPVVKEILPKDTAIFLKGDDPYVWAQTIETVLQKKGELLRLKRNVQKVYTQLQTLREDISTDQLIKLYRGMLALS